MKKIIIPTDFSENAYNALTYSLRLFAEVKCHFYLVHAYTPPIPEPANTMTSATTAKQLMDMSRKNAQRELDGVVERVKSSFANPGHTFETFPVYGFLADVIDQIAEEKEAELVIMGTKGASGIKEIVLGSNTARVIGHSVYPLLVIPENAVYTPIKEVAFFTDYDYYFEKSELKPLTGLLRLTGASLHIAHITAKGNQPGKQKELVKEHLLDILKPEKPGFYLLTSQYVEKAIMLFMQSRGNDLLCLVTKKQSFLERLFKKQITREVSYHFKKPMLVLRRGQ